MNFSNKKLFILICVFPTILCATLSTETRSSPTSFIELNTYRNTTIGFIAPFDLINTSIEIEQNRWLEGRLGKSMKWMAIKASLFQKNQVQIEFEAVINGQIAHRKIKVFADKPVALKNISRSISPSDLLPLSYCRAIKSINSIDKNKKDGQFVEKVIKFEMPDFEKDSDFYKKNGYEGLHLKYTWSKEKKISFSYLQRGKKPNLLQDLPDELTLMFSPYKIQCDSSCDLNRRQGKYCFINYISFEKVKDTLEEFIKNGLFMHSMQNVSLRQPNEDSYVYVKVFDLNSLKSAIIIGQDTKIEEEEVLPFLDSQLSIYQKNPKNLVYYKNKYPLKKIISYAQKNGLRNKVIFFKFWEYTSCFISFDGNIILEIIDLFYRTENFLYIKNPCRRVFFDKMKKVLKGDKNFSFISEAQL